jgi:hypothetical protein
MCAIARSSSRDSAMSLGMRHSSTKRRLNSVMWPIPSVARMPSAVDSSVAPSSDAVRERSSVRRVRFVWSVKNSVMPSSNGKVRTSSTRSPPRR